MIKHEYNLQTFYNEDEISYYLLGAFMADGCVHIVKNRNKKQVSLTSKDDDWLIAMNQFISPNKKLEKKSETCNMIQYNSTALGDWFISKGCVPRKSKIMDFPNIPVEYLPDFIRGCWDGDGTVSFNKNSNGGKNFQAGIFLTSGSLLFCNKMVIALELLGISSKVITHNTPERTIDGRTLKPSYNWRVRVSKIENCYNFCKLIYYNDNLLCLNRKKEVANNIIYYVENNNCIDCSINLGKIRSKTVRCKECKRLFYNANKRIIYSEKIK